MSTLREQRRRDQRQLMMVLKTIAPKLLEKDLRFGQFLSNLANIRQDCAFFYLEDGDLADVIMEYFEDK